MTEVEKKRFTNLLDGTWRGDHQTTAMLLGILAAMLMSSTPERQKEHGELMMEWAWKAGNMS